MGNKKLKLDNNTIIYCNECSYEFTILEIQIRAVRKTIDDQVLTKEYFSCPKCKHKYTTLVSNKTLRHLIRDYDKLVSKQKNLLNGKANQQELANNLNKMQDLQELIQEYQAELKRAWSNNE